MFPRGLCGGKGENVLRRFNLRFTSTADCILLGPIWCSGRVFAHRDAMTPSRAPQSGARPKRNSGRNDREENPQPATCNLQPSSSSVISSKAAQRPPSRDPGNSPATEIPPLCPVASLRDSGRNDRQENPQPATLFPSILHPSSFSSLVISFWKHVRADVTSLHRLSPLVRMPFVSGGAL